jgi:carbon storage regulator CsrA
MLILTRRPGETLTFVATKMQRGRNREPLDLPPKVAELVALMIELKVVIEITVLGNNGNQVRIGIDAPQYIACDRAEVFARKQREEGGNRQ